MRLTAVAASLSWIPSHSLQAVTALAVDVGVAHVDDPLPDRVTAADIPGLREADRFRFANVVGLWADVRDGVLVDAGPVPEADVVMGSTTMRLGGLGVTFPAVGLPVLRRGPFVHGDRAVLTQTAGGRTGAPLPRRVPHPPFVQWWAPLVWTTLEFTLRADGSSEVRLVDASSFPRHWIYDADGALVGKSGVTAERAWLDNAFGTRTPWSAGGDVRDEEALVARVESELERRLSRVLMGGARPRIRHLEAGELLTEQGAPGVELFLLLDGILSVVVDGEPIAEVGPGAILGERAILEGGHRTATLRAVTTARVAVAPADAVDRDALVELAGGHRREHGDG